MQCAIFSTLFSTRSTQGVFSSEDMPLFLIGDPKQSIYAFRGADINSYLSIRSMVPASRLLMLRRNWRSARPMIDAVNSFFQTAIRFTTAIVFLSPARNAAAKKMIF